MLDHRWGCPLCQVLIGGRPGLGVWALTGRLVRSGKLESRSVFSFLLGASCPLVCPCEHSNSVWFPNTVL
nr:MAG: putative 7.3 kDa protein [Erysiphe necator associated ambiguivirus 2]